MYISDEFIAFNDNCYIICLIPIFTSLMTEVQIISHLFLLKQRLNILNHHIEEYKFNVSNHFPKTLIKDQNPKKTKSISMIKNKLFSISEITLKNKIKFNNQQEQTKLYKFYVKSLNIFKKLLRFFMKIGNFKKNTIFDKNFEEIKGNGNGKIFAALRSRMAGAAADARRVA